MSRMLTRAVGLAGFVAALAGLVLTALGPHPGGLWDLADPSASAAGAAVGGGFGVLVLERGRDAERRVGGILVALGASSGVMALARAWALQSVGRAAGPLPATQAALALDRGSWFVALALLALLLVLFPDGRAEGRLQRGLLSAQVVLFPLAWLGVTFEHKPLGDPFSSFDPAFTPEWTAGPVVNAVVGALVLASLAGLVATVASVVTRFRGAPPPEREQFGWLALAGSLMPVTLAVCTVELPLTGRTSITSVFLYMTALSIPAAVGAAVLRLGLYRVDRVLVASVAYALTMGAGGLIYAAVLLSVGTMASAGSPVAATVATGVALIAGIRVNRRVRVAVDRRFDRERFEGIRAVEEFTDRVRRGLAEPEGIEAVLRKVLGDTGLMVLVAVPGAAGPDAWLTLNGRSWPGPGAAPSVVTASGEGTAIVHSARSAGRPRVLAAVADHAGLALQMVRLRVTLAASLAEVRQSRERILAAGYEERRRLERDLHDGAQQRLVSLGIELRLLQQSLPADARDLEPDVDHAVGLVEAAIADLRRIAAGVRPAQLNDGLVAALHELARTVPVPVSVVGEASGVSGAIAAAAYYVVCEAVTNAVRYAQASRITVTVTHGEASLGLTVADDGVGGAVPRLGSGLTGLSDRVVAHGGSLRIESPVGRGTLLEAVLPCAS